MTLQEIAEQVASSLRVTYQPETNTKTSRAQVGENMYRLEYVPVTGTARNLPEDFKLWQEFEANKLAANRHMGPKNYGVKGKKTLGDVLAEAERTYAGWTDAQINDYRMSHGHCVGSRY